MKSHEFLCYNTKSGIIREPRSLRNLIANQATATEFLQCYGFNDANKTPVCEGDILVLHITEDLMNPKKDMFFNSNLGKRISEDGHITHVICVLDNDNKFIGCPYTIYFCHDGHIDKTDDNKIDYECMSNDTNFPLYLINKGAIIESNIVVDTDALNKMYP